MRVIEPDELAARRRRARLGAAVVGRTHEKPAPRTLFSRVGQRERLHHQAVAADESAAALVGIGLSSVSADGGEHVAIERHGHEGASFQNRSDRYRSPPSGKIITTVAGLAGLKPELAGLKPGPSFAA